MPAVLLRFAAVRPRLAASVLVLLALLILTVPVLGAHAAPAPSDAVVTESSVRTFAEPPPSWYTPSLHRRVLRAGVEGVQVAPEYASLHCQGLGGPGVTAGGCMVFPYGCSMNFVFRDQAGGSYIGTAGHCVDYVGQEVVMQIGNRVDIDESPLLAAIGTVETFMNEGVGDDFGLVKIYPGFQVDPEIDVVGGPSGVFCGNNTGQPVKMWGHGYQLTATQGTPRAGIIVNSQAPGPYPEADGYNWIGPGYGGDSGNAVVQAADGRAIGNHTHGFFIGTNIKYGTRISRILEFLGPGFSLVNADGTTSPACGPPPPPPPPNEPPTARFTVSCSKTDCRLDGSGSADPDGIVVAYSWDFGDGTGGAGQVVQHTYPSGNGSYTVTLTIADDDGATDSESAVVTCTKKGKGGGPTSCK